MRRANATAGKNKVHSGRHRSDRIDDNFAHIRNDPRLAQLNPLRIQLFGQPADILVLGAARQDFISDDDNGCSGVGAGYAGHAGSL